MKAICFGAAGGGMRLYNAISEKYEILAFTDNDPRKWGKTLHQIKILPVTESLKLDYDVIVISSAPGYDSIKNQLIELGVSEHMIDSSFILAPLESRRVFLDKLAKIQQEELIPSDVQVAEAGVFEGDFAKWINMYYPNRTLHLFDTFEGFDKKDIVYETGLSDASLGDYSNTSIDIVLQKMMYKEHVVIHKGYFPESADCVTGKFCFVNLDLDLYEPTYNGLMFFKDKMIKNGVILVHDYFAENFKGPQKAVDRFLKENNKYSAYPIGDGISIMIVGF